MANSHQRRKMRRLLLRLGHSPEVIDFRKPARQVDEGHARSTRTPKRKAGDFRARISTLLKWTIFALGIPSLYVGIVSMLPLVAVEPQDPLSKEQPLSVPIRVINSGYLGINSAKLTCLVDRAESANHSIMTNVLAHEPVNLQLGDVGRGGYASTGCAIPMGFSGPFAGGHMTLTLEFRPDFSPFRMRRTFHLTGLSDESSRARWFLTSK